MLRIDDERSGSRRIGQRPAMFVSLTSIARHLIEDGMKEQRDRGASSSKLRRIGFELLRQNSSPDHIDLQQSQSSTKIELTQAPIPTNGVSDPYPAIK